MLNPKARMISRRTFLKTTALVGAGLIAAQCGAQSSGGGGSIKDAKINYLGWEGYDYAGALKPLTEPNNITVNSTYGGNNEEIFSKLKAGSVGQYDMISIYHGNILSLVQNDLIQPVDTSRLEHWNDLMPTFRNQPWQVIDGKVYSVPFTWGNTPNVYNPEFVPGGIQSWHDLLKPEFKEKIVILDNANQEIYVALNALGADLTQLITRQQLEAAKEWYKGVKAQARAIVPSYGEMADAMARKEAWLSGGAWAAIIGWVAEKGVTLEQVVPTEGTAGWCDNYCIPKEANLDVAYAWLNQMTSPEGQKELAVYLGQTMTNAKVVPLLPEELRKTYDNIEEELKKTPFPPDPPQETDDPNIATNAEWLAAWEEIKVS
ncbi:MAG: extracellular solute-binding protein [Chloroflexi bacterium]|nr:extracellular solute-binding protein [Chloroflexota bacterium]